MALTLINAFVVPEEQADTFVRDWQQTSEANSRQPGFIESRLHENTGKGLDETFRFVNVAQWESLEAVNAAHGKDPAVENQVRV